MTTTVSCAKREDNRVMMEAIEWDKSSLRSAKLVHSMFSSGTIFSGKVTMMDPVRGESAEAAADLTSSS